MAIGESLSLTRFGFESGTGIGGRLKLLYVLGLSCGNDGLSGMNIDPPNSVGWRGAAGHRWEIGRTGSTGKLSFGKGAGFQHSQCRHKGRPS